MKAWILTNKTASKQQAKKPQTNVIMENIVYN